MTFEINYLCILNRGSVVLLIKKLKISQIRGLHFTPKID